MPRFLNRTIARVATDRSLGPEIESSRDGSANTRADFAKAQEAKNRPEETAQDCPEEAAHHAPALVQKPIQDSNPQVLATWRTLTELVMSEGFVPASYLPDVGQNVAEFAPAAIKQEIAPAAASTAVAGGLKSRGIRLKNASMNRAGNALAIDVKDHSRCRLSFGEGIARPSTRASHCASSQLSPPALYPSPKEELPCHCSVIDGKATPAAKPQPGEKCPCCLRSVEKLGSTTTVTIRSESSDGSLSERSGGVNLCTECLDRCRTITSYVASAKAFVQIYLDLSHEVEKPQVQARTKVTVAYYSKSGSRLFETKSSLCGITREVQVAINSKRFRTSLKRAQSLSVPCTKPAKAPPSGRGDVPLFNPSGVWPLPYWPMPMPTWQMTFPSSGLPTYLSARAQCSAPNVGALRDIEHSVTALERRLKENVESHGDHVDQLSERQDRLFQAVELMRSEHKQDHSLVKAAQEAIEAERGAAARVVPEAGAGAERVAVTVIDPPGAGNFEAAADGYAQFDKLCVVCLDEERTQILVPCGHFIMCRGCAEELGKQGSCPKCRSTIEGVIRVFL